MKKVVIIGAGGHGKVVADIVDAMGDEVIGFLDDNPSLDTLGTVADYKKYADNWFIIAIGNPQIRERIVKNLNVKFYTAIHPSAVVSSSAQIKEGCAVMANAVISAGAVIGKHCIINTGAIVEHDNIIEDFAHVSVGARCGGTVQIGKRTWIGIGATVKNNITVCADCVIGAGAVVVKNVVQSGVYKGVPAVLDEKSAEKIGNIF